MTSSAKLKPNEFSRAVARSLRRAARQARNSRLLFTCAPGEKMTQRQVSASF